MEKWREVRKKLVLSDHAKENYNGTRIDGHDRTGITLNQIAQALSYGIKGYAGYVANKSVHRGIEVIFKVDDKGNYVVITYYRKKRKNSRNNIYKLFDEISS
ncbi:hypothetical protein [Aquibacillus saliphilus]|uniref:hypothetical protein n=1 Tax=Aquibacillus saliphilus TaxID=1909422 RepID=UPI001CEFC890|nr:hypothetical protein [Aquibacillus saliphilus]